MELALCDVVWIGGLSCEWWKNAGKMADCAVSGCGCAQALPLHAFYSM